MKLKLAEQVINLHEATKSSKKLSAVEIKKYLKKKGFNPKNINVRSTRSTYDFILKDLLIDKFTFEKTISDLEKHVIEKTTGDVLKGGNIFTTVSYDKSSIDKAIIHYSKIVIDYINSNYANTSQHITPLSKEVATKLKSKIGISLPALKSVVSGIIDKSNDSEFNLSIKV